MSLRDGETGVIGGLVSDEDRKTKNGIPGLSDIPALGAIFTGVDNEKVRTEVLLTITPHILNGIETPSKDLQAFWSGTEESYSTRPLFADFPTVGDVRREPPPATPPVPPLPGAPRSPDEHSGTVAPDSKGAGTLQAVPLASQVAEGQEAKVDLVISDVKDLSEAEFSFNFNPALLDLKGAVEGSFLKSDGRQTSFVTSVNTVTGQVNLHLVRMGDGEGKSGSGTLATLTFIAKSKGDALVAVNEGKFLSSSKASIPIGINGGTIKVQ
jgi:general secretion pathway protein D